MIVELEPGDWALMLELAVSVLAVYICGALVRYFWLTRRRPVRKTAPTGTKPWVTPAPQRWNDDTPVL